MSTPTLEKCGEFFKDLRALQSELETLKKDVQGYGYKYADLTQTLEVLKPVLFKYGFCVIQLGAVIEGKQVLRTIVGHVSGVSFAGEFLINPDRQSRGVDKNGDPNVAEAHDPQAIGSWWTYGRRYSLQGAFGLTADDDDGAEATRSPKSQRTNAPKINATITNAVPGGAIGGFLIDFGKFNGKKLEEIPPADLRGYISYLRTSKNLKGQGLQLVEIGEKYLASQSVMPKINGAPVIKNEDYGDEVPF